MGIITRAISNRITLDKRWYGLDISKKVHEANEAPNFDQLKVENINITGMTSPEGPATKGPDTIKENNTINYGRL